MAKNNTKRTETMERVNASNERAKQNGGSRGAVEHATDSTREVIDMVLGEGAENGCTIAVLFDNKTPERVNASNRKAKKIDYLETKANKNGGGKTIEKEIDGVKNVTEKQIKEAEKIALNDSPVDILLDNATEETSPFLVYLNKFLDKWEQLKGTVRSKALSAFEGVEKSEMEAVKEENRNLKKQIKNTIKYFRPIRHDTMVQTAGISAFLGAILSGDMNIKDFDEEMIKASYKALQNVRATIEEFTALMEASLCGADIPMRDITKKSIEMNLCAWKTNFEQKNITFSFSMNIDQFLANKSTFETTLLNFLRNAIKFTPENGNIDLSLIQKDGFVLMSVADTGIGMGKEYADQLFRKKDQNISRKGTNGEIGNGDGLLNTQELIENLGGKTWVESEEGKGSTFYATFPSPKRETMKISAPKLELPTTGKSLNTETMPRTCTLAQELRKKLNTNNSDKAPEIEYKLLGLGQLEVHMNEGGDHSMFEESFKEIALLITEFL